MRTHRLLLPLLLAALAAPACTPLVDEAASTTCPCAAGWTCCEGQCVKGGSEVCPPPPPPAPDTLAPEAPLLDAPASAAPSPALQVQLAGSAEALAHLAVYAQAACEGEPVAELEVGAGGRFQVAVALAPDATRHFSARARDAAGNASGCSAPLALTHDGTPPAAPVLEVATPAGPSPTVTRPLLSGRTEPHARVRLFADAACTLGLPHEGAADAAGAFALEAEVPLDATRTFHARATDAAGNASACSEAGLSFTHDAQPPLAPVLSSRDTPSPSTLTEVRWALAGEPHARVVLFSDEACQVAAGEPLALDAAGAATLAFTAAQNATTRRWAQALDAAGNASGCAALGAHVHDSQAPYTPSVRFSPPSPSNSRDVTLSGLADWGAQVLVYGAEGCPAAALLGEVRASATTGNWELPLTVQATTRVYTRSVDAAGNTSPCSSWGYEYVLDTSAPLAPTRVRLTEPSVLHAAPTYAAVLGWGEQGVTAEAYAGAACTGEPVATATTELYSAGAVRPFRIPLPGVLQAPWSAYSVRLRDAAGNRSACVAAGGPREAAPGEQGWEAPQSLPVRAAALAFDPQGRLHLLGTAGATGRTELHRRASAAPDAAWERVEAPALDGTHQLLFDAAGNLLVTSSYGPLRVLRYDAASATWRAPELLTAEGRSGYMAVAALGPDGTAAVCWDDERATYVPEWDPAAAVRCAVAPPGGPFGPSEVLAPGSAETGGSNSGPRVFVDAAGRVRAAWYHDLGPYSATAELHGRTREPGGAWDATEVLAPSVSALDAASDGAGGAWVAYRAPAPEGGGSAVWVRRARTGAPGWGAPERVSEGATPWGLRVVSTAPGQLMVLWSENGVPGISSGSMHLRHFTPEVGWGFPHMLTNHPYGPYLPWLVPAGPGAAWAVWPENVSVPATYPASPYVPTLEVQRLRADTGFGPAEVVLYDPLGGAEGHPVVAGDAAGRLAVHGYFFNRGPERSDLRLLRVFQ